MRGHDCDAAASNVKSCLRFAAAAARMRVSALLFKVIVRILGRSRLAPC